MKEYFSVQELAERWGYQEKTLRNLIIKKKRMAYTRFGRKIMIRFQDILQFETEHRNEANV